MEWQPKQSRASDGVHAAAGGVLDVGGLALLRAHGEIQPAERIVEADPALVECAVAFEDVGLAGLSAVQRPRADGGNGLSLAGDRHDAAVSLPRDVPLEAAVFEIEAADARAESRPGGGLQRLCHGCGAEARHDLRMARGARLVARGSGLRRGAEARRQWPSRPISLDPGPGLLRLALGIQLEDDARSRSPSALRLRR